MRSTLAHVISLNPHSSTARHQVGMVPAPPLSPARKLRPQQMKQLAHVVKNRHQQLPGLVMPGRYSFFYLWFSILSAACLPACLSIYLSIHHLPSFLPSLSPSFLYSRISTFLFFKKSVPMDEQSCLS